MQFDAPQPGFPSRTQPPNVGLTIGAQSGSVPGELIRVMIAALPCAAKKIVHFPGGEQSA